MNETSGTLIGILAVLASLVGLFTAIFWLVVGWGAMRAHEQIAYCLRDRLER